MSFLVNASAVFCAVHGIVIFVAIHVSPEDDVSQQVHMNSNLLSDRGRNQVQLRLTQNAEKYKMRREKIQMRGYSDGFE